MRILRREDGMHAEIAKPRAKPRAKPPSTVSCGPRPMTKQVFHQSERVNCQTLKFRLMLVIIPAPDCVAMHSETILACKTTREAVQEVDSWEHPWGGGISISEAVQCG